MSGFWKKIQGSWINSILFSCFLLAIFIALFYISNLGIFFQNNSYKERVSSFDQSNKELKKRIGSMDVSNLSYDEWAIRYGLTSANNKYDDDPDGDGLPNYLEYVYGTNPLNLDTDGDGFSDKQEITNGYDPDAPGDARPSVEISIAKINISAPMVWSNSADENNQLEDLKKGVAHFPKTAASGQPGNMIISGHSSNYIWVKGDYNYIFKDLNNLEKGDVITVKTTQQNGRVIIFHYSVADKFVTTPEDHRIFENTQDPTLTLSTCWPLGTNFRRLIVKADLVK